MELERLTAFRVPEGTDNLTVEIPPLPTQAFQILVYVHGTFIPGIPCQDCGVVTEQATSAGMSWICYDCWHARNMC